MTIEEKAKAYDEAIAKAQKELQTCGSTDCDAARQIYRFFPELKESEDERIRKSIIAFLKENLETGRAEETWSLSGLKRWIAWLEKQGEQKLVVIIPKFRVGDEIKTSNEESLTITKIDENGYWSEDLFICDFDEECTWDLVGQKPADKVEPKFKVKYAGNEYNVFETKDIAGVTFYGIEDEPNHIDYVKAENCEIISVYAIKENGSPYPTKPAVFSEKKPKRMISAEAKEAMYDKPACVGRNDTLLDLLHKMPSCITVCGIDYHFVLKKTIAYMAYYEGEGEGSGKVIFWMAGEPIALLTVMLEKLKEEGLLE